MLQWLTCQQLANLPSTMFTQTCTAVRWLKFNTKILLIHFSNLQNRLMFKGDKSTAAQMCLTEDSSSLDADSQLFLISPLFKSLLTYSFICWFNNLSLRDRNSLKSIIKICSKITGTRQKDLGSLCDQQIARQTQNILSSPGNILAN